MEYIDELLKDLAPRKLPKPVVPDVRKSVIRRLMEDGCNFIASTPIKDNGEWATWRYSNSGTPFSKYRQENGDADTASSSSVVVVNKSRKQVVNQTKSRRQSTGLSKEAIEKIIESFRKPSSENSTKTPRRLLSSNVSSKSNKNDDNGKSISSMSKYSTRVGKTMQSGDKELLLEENLKCREGKLSSTKGVHCKSATRGKHSGLPEENIVQSPRKSIQERMSRGSVYARTNEDGNASLQPTEKQLSVSGKNVTQSQNSVVVNCSISSDDDVNEIEIRKSVNKSKTNKINSLKLTFNGAITSRNENSRCQENNVENQESDYELNEAASKNAACRQSSVAGVSMKTVPTENQVDARRKNNSLKQQHSTNKSLEHCTEKSHQTECTNKKTNNRKSLSSSSSSDEAREKEGNNRKLFCDNPKRNTALQALYRSSSSDDISTVNLRNIKKYLYKQNKNKVHSNNELKQLRNNSKKSHRQTRHKTSSNRFKNHNNSSSDDDLDDVENNIVNKRSRKLSKIKQPLNRYNDSSADDDQDNKTSKVVCSSRCSRQNGRLKNLMVASQSEVTKPKTRSTMVQTLFNDTSSDDDDVNNVVKPRLDNEVIKEVVETKQNNKKRQYLGPKLRKQLESDTNQLTKGTEVGGKYKRISLPSDSESCEEQSHTKNTINSPKRRRTKVQRLFDESCSDQEVDKMEMNSSEAMRDLQNKVNSLLKEWSLEGASNQQDLSENPPRRRTTMERTGGSTKSKTSIQPQPLVGAEGPQNSTESNREKSKRSLEQPQSPSVQKITSPKKNVINQRNVVVVPVNAQGESTKKVQASVSEKNTRLPQTHKKYKENMVQKFVQEKKSFEADEEHLIKGPPPRLNNTSENNNIHVLRVQAEYNTNKSTQMDYDCDILLQEPYVTPNKNFTSNNNRVSQNSESIAQLKNQTMLSNKRTTRSMNKENYNTSSLVNRDVVNCDGDLVKSITKEHRRSKLKNSNRGNEKEEGSLVTQTRDSTKPKRSIQPLFEAEGPHNSKESNHEKSKTSLEQPQSPSVQKVISPKKNVLIQRNVVVMPTNAQGESTEKAQASVPEKNNRLSQTNKKYEGKMGQKFAQREESFEADEEHLFKEPPPRLNNTSENNNIHVLRVQAEYNKTNKSAQMDYDCDILLHKSYVTPNKNVTSNNNRVSQNSESIAQLKNQTMLQNKRTKRSMNKETNDTNSLANENDVNCDDDLAKSILKKNLRSKLKNSNQGNEKEEESLVAQTSDHTENKSVEKSVLENETNKRPPQINIHCDTPTLSKSKSLKNLESETSPLQSESLNAHTSLRVEKKKTNRHSVRDSVYVSLERSTAVDQMSSRLVAPLSIGGSASHSEVTNDLPAIAGPSDIDFLKPLPVKKLHKRSKKISQSNNPSDSTTEETSLSVRRSGRKRTATQFTQQVVIEASYKFLRRLESISERGSVITNRKEYKEMQNSMKKSRSQKRNATTSNVEDLSQNADETTSKRKPRARAKASPKQVTSPVVKKARGANTARKTSARTRKKASTTQGGGDADTVTIPDEGPLVIMDQISEEPMPEVSSKDNDVDESAQDSDKGEKAGKRMLSTDGSKRGNYIERSIHNTTESFECFKRSKHYDPTEEENISVAQGLKHNGSQAGRLKISGNCKKSKEMLEKSFMHLTVLKGRGKVTVQDTYQILEAGHEGLVPMGSTYSISNDDPNETLEVFYVNVQSGHT